MLNIAKQKLFDAKLAKSAATASKNPRQCNNIQANANDSNEENSDSSQIYSVATINKIDVKGVRSKFWNFLYYWSDLRY